MKLRIHRRTILVLIAGLGLCLYAYLTPPGPLASDFLVRFSLHRFGGDWGEYGTRFALSFLLMGLLPLGSAFVLGYSPKDLGLGRPQRRLFTRSFFLLWGLVIFMGIVSGFQDDLSSFYPYGKSLAHEAMTGRLFLIPIHALLYGLFYYLPWEILFRGILILPFLDDLSDDAPLGSLLGIASLQAIPSALIHFGHPLSETLAALPFGVLAAILVLRTRTIWPVLILHGSIGIVLDTTIILRGLL